MFPNFLTSCFSFFSILETAAQYEARISVLQSERAQWRRATSPQDTKVCVSCLLFFFFSLCYLSTEAKTGVFLSHYGSVSLFQRSFGFCIKMSVSHFTSAFYTFHCACRASLKRARWRVPLLHRVVPLPCGLLTTRAQGQTLIHWSCWQRHQIQRQHAL